MKYKMISSLGAVFIGILCLLYAIVPISYDAYAQVMDTQIEGKAYSFGEDDHYDYLESGSEFVSTASSSYGRFKITGEMNPDGEKDGMRSFSVIGDEASLTYSYDDILLNADSESWHLVDDNTKKVAGVALKSNIKKGAIILQTSKDGKKWLTDVELTNVFANTPVQNESFYTANSIQLDNGCYYRLIVVYKTARKVGEKKFLFVKADDIEYSKTAEVYEFYLHSSKQVNNEYTQTKRLGAVVNTGKDNGYSGSNPLDRSDPHFGWEIGDFYVSGFTWDTVEDGKPVFLKNVGDQVTLWFKLKQDIDRLNDNDILTINEDLNGYDQHFQIDRTNMGRGTLIIRYKDKEGNLEDEIYTNYLAANATTSADTVVKLFEEGDYEVALDYEIKKTPRKVGSVEVIPEYSNYRIFFEFKVRNGNCMVYPFDVATGSELTDESITPNGFKLDTAKSKYLQTVVKRAVVTMGANGYVEDVRFNKLAKPGDQYTDEGIYYFKVKNLYTGEETTKTIYVGSSPYMNALSVNRISVTELNNQISQGGVIETNGEITMPPPEEPEPEILEPEPSGDSVEEESIIEEVTEEELTTDTEEVTDSSESQEDTSEPYKEEESLPKSEDQDNQTDLPVSEDEIRDASKKTPIVPIVIVGVVVIGGVVAGIISKRTKKNDGD